MAFVCIRDIYDLIGGLVAGNNFLQIRSEMIATAAPTSNSSLLFARKSTVIGHDDFTLTVKSYDSSLSPSLYVVETYYVFGAALELRSSHEVY